MVKKNINLFIKLRTICINIGAFKILKRIQNQLAVAKYFPNLLHCSAIPFVHIEFIEPTVNKSIQSGVKL